MPCSGWAASLTGGRCLWWAMNEVLTSRRKHFDTTLSGKQRTTEKIMNLIHTSPERIAKISKLEVSLGKLIFL